MYIYITHKHLGGFLFVVFVKATHKAGIKYVHSNDVSSGVMGVMGNKGGVCIRFQFYDSSLCLVNSHLAAHRENVAGQNIFYKTSFDIGEEAVKDAITIGNATNYIAFLEFLAN